MTARGILEQSCLSWIGKPRNCGLGGGEINPNPLTKFKLTAEEVNIGLARRYFYWAGPATLKEFQWFSGLGVKAAKTATDPLGLTPLETGGERLMLSEEREAFESFKPPKEPQYALVSSLDGISLFRRDLKSLLTDEDREHAPGIKTGLKDWESHAILDRGRWIGSWEYDPDSGTIVWAVWVKDKALKAAVKRTEEFVRRDLGDARLRFG